MSLHGSSKPHRESDGSTPRVTVTCALVAHEGAFLPPGSQNPVSPELIETECVRCESAGASVVHLHVRDRRGRIVSETDVFGETLDRITSRTSLVINGSTGGASSLTREDRCLAVRDPRVEIASLNMGSTNFGDSVYVNTVEDIRYCARRIYATGTVPELEVFASSMVQTARSLAVEGTLRAPLHFNICLGFPGSTPATIDELVHLARSLPAGAPWGFLHEGMVHFRLLAASVEAGARAIRVGFEDSGYLRPDRPARSNAELVEAVVSTIRDLGCEPASVEDARAMWALPPRREIKVP